MKMPKFTLLQLAQIIGAVTASDFLSESFSSPPYDFDVQEAIEICRLDVSCAGVTEAKNEDTKVVFHSFLPSSSPASAAPLANSTTLTTRTTFQDSKPFTFHSGWIQNQNPSSILSVDEGNMDIDQAKHYCRNHPECVAYMYKVHSHTQLKVPERTVFVSKIESFERSNPNDEWRTYIANDIRKAPFVNASNLIFDEEILDYPFTSCCQNTEMPSLEAIAEADTLERIPCNISRQEFQEKYEYARKPVMLVGCDKDWPALTRWKPESLLPRFDNATEWRAQVTEDDDLKEQAKWSEIIDAMDRSGSFYIFDSLDHPAGKEIEKDYTTPHPFQQTDLYRNLNEFPDEDYGSRRWFCVGSAGTGAYPHTDPLGTDAWNSLISGHKWWIIYPSSLLSPDGLTCNTKCSVPDSTLQHWYASIGINSARSEYHLEKKAFHVLQKAGETIYVPHERAHSVYNMDDTVAITANFGSAYNLEKVWKTLVKDGNAEHWKHVYYQELNRDQRAFVRRTAYWPPEQTITSL